MSFTTTPIAPPTNAPANENQGRPLTGKERAIAKMTEGLKSMGITPKGHIPPIPQRNPEAPIPINPSNVSVEELGAITSSTSVPEAQTGTTESGVSEVTETTQEPAKPSDPPALSSQFAQLARREKAFRAQVNQFKADQAAFKASQDAAKAPATPSFDPSRYVAIEDIQKAPFDALNKAGLTYEQLVEQQLNQPSPEQRQLNQTIQALEAKIKSLEEGQETSKKAFEQQSQDSYQQALTQIRTEAKNLVNSDPDTYETIKATGSIKDVVDLIEDTWKNGLGDDYPKGTLLTVEDAARMVEEHLAEEAYKLSQLKKIQKRFTTQKPVAPANATAQTAGVTKQPQGSKTLTNAVGTQRQYTAKERAVLAGQYGANWREKVGA